MEEKNHKIWIPLLLDIILEHFEEVGGVKPGSGLCFGSPSSLQYLSPNKHFSYLAERSPAARPAPGWTQPSPSACERAAGSVWRWWSPSASAGPPSPSPETPSGLPGDPEEVRVHTLYSDYCTVYTKMTPTSLLCGRITACVASYHTVISICRGGILLNYCWNKNVTRTKKTHFTFSSWSKINFIGKNVAW